MTSVDRVAIVTGGGRGIGAASAHALANRGACVVVAARTRNQIESVAREIRAAGGEATAISVDVANEASVGHLLSETERVYGAPTILVNCAGVYGPIGPIRDNDAAKWAAAIAINLVGTFLCCRAAIEPMSRQGGGRIINMSGGGATAPLPRFSAYAASKAGVVRFSETLAEEVASLGIAVNSIAPGAIDTTLQDEVLAAGEAAGPLLARIKAMRETGAGGTPIDVPVSLMVYLAFDAPVGLTGRLIAAPHDPWREWTPEQIAAMGGTPWYTLRRIDPHTIRPLKDQI